MKINSNFTRDEITLAGFERPVFGREFFTPIYMGATKHENRYYIRGKPPLAVFSWRTPPLRFKRGRKEGIGGAPPQPPGSEPRFPSPSRRCAGYSIRGETPLAGVWGCPPSPFNIPPRLGAGELKELFSGEAPVL